MYQATPQIALALGEVTTATGAGARVFINGVELQNVASASVTNDVAPDALAQSSLTVRLVGESILVRPPGSCVQRRGDFADWLLSRIDEALATGQLWMLDRLAIARAHGNATT